MCLASKMKAHSSMQQVQAIEYLSHSGLSPSSTCTEKWVRSKCNGQMELWRQSYRRSLPIAPWLAQGMLQSRWQSAEAWKLPFWLSLSLLCPSHSTWTGGSCTLWGLPWRLRQDPPLSATKISLRLSQLKIFLFPTRVGQCWLHLRYRWKTQISVYHFQEDLPPRLRWRILKIFTTHFSNHHPCPCFCECRSIFWEPTWVILDKTLHGDIGYESYHEMLPDFRGRELGQKFHTGSCCQRAEQGVHNAVDVMQRQAMQYAVAGLPLPRRTEAWYLGVDAAVRVQSTCHMHQPEQSCELQSHEGGKSRLVFPEEGFVFRLKVMRVRML